MRLDSPAYFGNGSRTISAYGSVRRGGSSQMKMRYLSRVEEEGEGVNDTRRVAVQEQEERLAGGDLACALYDAPGSSGRRDWVSIPPTRSTRADILMGREYRGLEKMP